MKSFIDVYLHDRSYVKKLYIADFRLVNQLMVKIERSLISEILKLNKIQFYIMLQVKTGLGIRNLVYR